MKKLLIAILKNESDQDYKHWVESCDKRKNIIDYDIIDLTKSDWINKVKSKNYNVYLTIPPGVTSTFKQLYDERVSIIANVLNKNIYPSLQEVLIYENKRYFAYWLMANSLEMPKTHIFYSKSEAINFVKNISFPLVAKLNIGAAGNGVQFLSNTTEAINYIEIAFSKNGLEFKSGPKIAKGNVAKKIRKVIFKKGFLINRLKEYKALSNENQKGFVIFQDFVKHDFEWRCVRIGNSFFAHKKIVIKDKASGTLKKNYDNPPVELLEYIFNLSEKHNIKSAAIDLFESNGRFLINEIQCIFGQSDPYQMLVNEKPGRYQRIDGKWIFEEGLFNTNKSYDLRLEHALSLIDK